jgi:hypothetical protein
MRLAIVSGPMCAAAIVVLVAVPSHASKSCMTQTEARARFATSHLYWHGPNHCWDANAPRHGIVHRFKPRDHREAQDADEEEAKKVEPKWRNAMSEMLPPPDDTSVAAPALRSLPQAVWAYDDGEAPASTMAWLDRWVEIAQVAPAGIFSSKAERAEPLLAPVAKVEPLVTPTRVILIFLGLVLTIVVIELVFRSTIREGRR